jgi:hypothetical protein
MPIQSQSHNATAQIKPQAQEMAVEAQIKPGVTRVENKNYKAPFARQDVDGVPPATALRSGRRYLFFGGGAVLVLGLIALALLKLPGVIASGMVQSSPTPTALRSGVVSVTTSTIMPGIAVAGPAASPTALLVFTPTATIPTSGVYIRINNIQVVNGRYVVNYQTFNYQEQLSGTHEHFFFNTVPPDQAGEPGKGPWMLFAGPNPFRGLTVANRPSGATQLCALVAHPDHTVQPNTGNCYDLPNQ